MVIFSKRLVYLANPISLAVALSMSSGVMMFISLVEIFGESVHLFTEGVKTEGMSDETADGHGWLLATACFGAGIALIYFIDFIVHKISPEVEATEIENLENLEALRDSMTREKSPAHFVEAQTPKEKVLVEETKGQLIRMGVLSAIAIGIHNIPEGIATYVGAMRNTKVGFSLAIGIALHNIPEGIAVAAPIYFATGSRKRGIMWCVISALAEPLGAVLAWAAIGDGMDPISEGILFGLVCGIMVCICIKELYPTAYKFAKGRTHLVAAGSFIGMFIMVTSLILFGYAVVNHTAGLNGMSVGMSVASGSDNNVALAFLLTTAAGFATVVGGFIVFSKRLLSAANPLSLAVALSVSAGVMLFISLVELFNNAVTNFAEGIKDNKKTPEMINGCAWLYATLFFSGGIVLIYVIDVIVHKLTPAAEQHEIEHLNLPQVLAAEERKKLAEKQGDGKVESANEQEDEVVNDGTRAHLKRMGILSAIAIGIHNIPEGIATYVGSTQNSKVGFSLAVGIGLHNIPEGIAVAAPIYFATGSRWRGIFWCVVSAMAEPFGGVLAWLAIGDGVNPVVQGALFGVVCGIMVCISVKELLPTAIKLAGPNTAVVTLGVFLGMFIMVTSMVLFAFAGT
ncbi:TPA: hypothetical protein N0F65_012245 [Lagenidium giganteum]|uniref:Zinc transporter n=1 Tax=Lagenidium giganteum TaxID=4803 RepID=A0AAV2ZIF5_9STRA|nr:TPA: hypothetical protein N0F65_012245 [Lagenidium giganteum]